MNKQKLGKKNFLEVAVSIVITMMFVMPVSSMVATFESENISADTIISIEPTMQKVKKGETFTISIYVIPIESVIRVNVGNLSFNPSLIHANAVTEGNLFDPYETFTPGSINNTDGNIAGIEGATTPSNATTDMGILCDISFTAQEEIGTSVLDIEDVVVTNLSGSTISITVDDGSVTIVAWSVMLTFNEYSGKSDYVVFAEMPDAIDGTPADIYDVGKPGQPPGPPYLYAWFDNNLPTPHNFLWEDYRRYPDTEKVWDLHAQWKSTVSTDITISWDTSGFMGCEYDSVILTRYNPFPIQDPVGWEFAADMFTENIYTYAPRPCGGEWLTDHFQINATVDTVPPEITSVILRISDPIDTDIGWENASCVVIDTCVGVKDVKLIMTYPNTTTEKYPMVNIHGTDTYYYNTTFTIVGDYTYLIWADDTNDNIAQSTPETFILPPNYEMNMDYESRLIDFWDLVEVVKYYMQTGTPGWIRADVNNDGIVDFWDLVEIVKYYMEPW